MAVSQGSCAQIFGQFHPNCAPNIELSENRLVASGNASIELQSAFSNAPIPKGQRFSLKILQADSGWGLPIGVTTKSPDSGLVPQGWNDIKTDQYWFVEITSSTCIAYHKGQSRNLQWKLDRSPGNTFGVAVSQAGELHLYHNGWDVGVAWEGLPTDGPLWGFVDLGGGYKVETNYIIAKGHPQPLGQREVTPAPAGHPQDYAGQTYHFIERPPDGLTCAVCQALAHDPVQANCCGNVYCALCIEKWKGRSNSCPACRSTEQSDPPFNVFRDRKTYRDIRSLSVHCPNKCGKKMELSEVDNHLTSDSGCPLQVVDCSNKCGRKERRAAVKKHMTSECCLRRKKCQYCPLVSTHEQVTGIHLKECPNFPLDCPNKCSAQGLTRNTVPTHRAVCPLQRVRCDFKRFGCAIVLLRKEVKGHLNASVESHLQLTKKKVEDQETQLKDMEVRAEKAERERQRMKEVIARLVDRVEQLEFKK